MSGRETSWRICPMQQRHLKALAALEALCFSEPWSEQGLLEELENPAACFLVCETPQGETAGYCGAHLVLDEGFLANLAVFPQHRGQGAASALLCGLAAQAAARSVATLSLEVRASNTAAIALYERLGYQKAGVRRGFYRAPTEDAWIYTLRLDVPWQETPCGR